MRYSLLIPSAILVPESMRDAGDLPAVAYPLGEGVVLDAILGAQKGRISECVVVACENAAAARRVAAVHDGVRVEEMFEVGDLLDTVAFGFSALGTSLPVVINFSDTVAEGGVPSTPDSLYLSKERYGAEWTYVRVDKTGEVRTAYDRDRSAEDMGGRGDAFVGVLRIDDPAEFLDAAREATEFPREDVSRFFRALEFYSKKRPMTALRPENWLDIGHPAGYVGAQLQVRAREFNYIDVDRERAVLRKTSKNADKFVGEIRWYLKLPADVAWVAPRIFSYSLAYDEPWVEMEYYPYHTLHSLWIDGALDRARWARVFDRLSFLLDDLGRHRLRSAHGEMGVALGDMYLNKTLKRLDKLRNVEDFAPMFGRSVAVNGDRYPSLDEVCDILRREVPVRLCSGDADIVIIHGDLCFANVMIDDSLSFLRVVDPRGSFGPWDIYGDRRYELAKLAHSVDGGYDLIIKDRMDVFWDADEARIDLSLKQPEGPDLWRVMQECLSKQLRGCLPEVRLIESLLFLSMVPLHGESRAHQMAMIATGLRILDEAIGIRED